LWLVFFSLASRYLDQSAFAALEHLPALPMALKVTFALAWETITPWHWAQWIIAAAGLGMLFLAGNAVSHYKTGNWSTLSHQWPSQIRLMAFLQRLRSLATIALLLMALGALLLQYRSWQKHVSVPSTWIAALERFYQMPSQPPSQQ